MHCKDDEKLKKKLLARLRRIEGQVRGVQKMIERDEYCVDIITQTQAAKSALSAVEDALLEDHLSSCVVKQVKSGKEKKALGEILKIYKLAKKK